MKCCKWIIKVIAIAVIVAAVAASVLIFWDQIVSFFAKIGDKICSYKKMSIEEELFSDFSDFEDK